MTDEKKSGPVEVKNPVTQQGSTFAERKAAAERAEANVKQVDDESSAVEDKAVRKPVESKRTSKK